MSELSHSLELLGFISLDDITEETLKKAFKIHIVKAHPDKGGNEELFDKILHSYLYLTETLRRISGGRDTLYNSITPDDIKTRRPDEIINKLFEEFEKDEFNILFEKHDTKEIHGYSSWLKEGRDESETEINLQTNNTVKPIPYVNKNIITKSIFNEKDLNKEFEKALKPTVSNKIILHPDSMAYVSGKNLGTSLISSDDCYYTSELFTKPVYTDVYSAFTTDNTIYDKVINTNILEKSLDELIAERNKEIIPYNDDELEAIRDFENKRYNNNINNMSRIKEYFNTTKSTHDGFIHDF